MSSNLPQHIQMRKISLFDNEHNSKFCGNKIKTTKYNFITFLPLSLLFQFKNYSNIYFLLVAIILAIKKISPQDPTVAIIPFIFVIFVGILVEAFEEFKKWNNDKQFNNSLSIKINITTHKEESVKWSELIVGNIIKIKKNETIPADILIIKTSSLNHFCYMQTTNLDGESALKPRELIPMLQGKLCTEELDPSPIEGSVIEIEPPSNNIYKCNGSMTLKNGERSFIQVENILLRGTTLKNVDYVYGVIIYTGKDTKIMRNIQSSSVKSSSIEDIINNIIIGVIIFVFVLCITCSIIGIVFVKKHEPEYEKGKLKYDYIFYTDDGDFDYVLEFFRIFGAFFILFNNIIPISMSITFTLAKVIQIIMIEFDPELKKDPGDQLKVLSTRLQEDLGKVSYIFTDKTGTLTRNEMVFKGCSIYGMLFYEEQNTNREDELIQALKSSMRNNMNAVNKSQDKVNEEPKISVLEKLKHFLDNDLPLPINIPDNNMFSSSRDAIFEFAYNIALNHNVLNEYDEEKKTSFFQGPNPDEVALVSMAKDIGIEFIERIGKIIKIHLEHTDTIKEFEVLQVFKYSSERKRSGIIIKDKETQEITLYVKGADDKLFAMSDDFSQTYLLKLTKNHLDSFAKNGLRTLCYASKRLSRKEYEQWEKEYEMIKTQAMMDISKLPEVEEKIGEIEKNLLLMGVSGLEDRLQDETREDISKFIEAGIQMWMITGDQMDTAESIGYSSNFFEDDTEVFKIKASSKKEEILKSMKKILREISAMELQLRQYKLEHKDKTRRINASYDEYIQSPKINGDMQIKFNNNIMRSSRITNAPIDEKGTLVRRPSAPDLNKERLLGEVKDNDNSMDDISIIKFMFEKHLLGNSSIARKEANTFVRYVEDGNHAIEKKNDIKSNKTGIIDTPTGRNPEALYQHYKKELGKIIERKKKIDKVTKITSLNFQKKDKLSRTTSELSLLNFGLVIEGNALVHCLSPEVEETFWKLIQKSRSIVCCRCTPVQKSNIVDFVQKKSGKLCLAIGDGGNDVNMIKKANVGIGIFGKEGHQAAYNADYAISQFKYLKHLLFYHGRYTLMRNSYFIYFFFYKGLIFCFPNFWFGFMSGFSGANFWDFVWFTMYTGLVSTMPPCVIMVFEEDIDVSFEGRPDKEMLKNLLPDIYREYRDSNPFNEFKFFTVFFLGIVHSALFYVWGIYPFHYGITDSSGKPFEMWDFSTMCLLTVLIVQYVILFIDTNKYYIWVYLCHGAQILVNLLFGIIYGLCGDNELGAYTFDVLSNWTFWLTLICCIHMCLIPVYFSRYFDFLFSDTLINNLRNKRMQNDFAKKMYIKKIEHMVKCTRSLAKFKKIYNALDEFKADNFADRKMREIVQLYKTTKTAKTKTIANRMETEESKLNTFIPKAKGEFQTESKRTFLRPPTIEMNEIKQQNEIEEEDKKNEINMNDIEDYYYTKAMPSKYGNNRKTIVLDVGDPNVIEDEKINDNDSKINSVNFDCHKVDMDNDILSNLE